MITIVGFPAAGKSTLAALFPNPIFIQAEDSGTVFETWPEDKQPLLLRQLPEPLAERNVRPKQVIFDQLQEIYESEHNYKTLVIDTTTSLQALFESEVVKFEDPCKSIQDCMGGYQKAYDVISGFHREIIQKCIKIRAKRDMSIVFLAHTEEQRRKSTPESADQYTVYGIRMHKKSRDIYLSECDAVIYIKQHETITGGETNKKGQQIKPGRIKRSLDRVLITSADGVIGFIDAKSRYSMPTEIDFVIENQEKPWETVNPLLEFIPYFNQEKEVKQNGEIENVN